MCYATVGCSELLPNLSWYYLMSQKRELRPLEMKSFTRIPQPSSRARVEPGGHTHVNFALPSGEEGLVATPLVHFGSSTPLWSLPQRGCQKDFSRLEEPAQPQRPTLLLLDICPLHHSTSKGVVSSGGSFGPRRDPRGGGREKPLLWERASICSFHSIQEVSFGSPVLIIRANYVQAQGEHVPKFMSLCATTTMRVLCASP